MNKVIVNRSFLKKFDFSDDFILDDKYIYGCKVIGIIEDFNFRPLHETIQPLALFPVDERNSTFSLNWVFFRTHEGYTQQTAEYVVNTWKKFRRIYEANG